MKKISEVLIISGKGGTGKTTIAASLAQMMKNKVIADVDVDASDMFILMKPEILEEHIFSGNKKALIDQDKCTNCGICANKCRFDAIPFIDNKYEVKPHLCDSCTLCVEFCPENAITMIPTDAGKWFKSKTQYGDFVHAKLYPGAENSGNLVTMVKHQAKEIAKEKNNDFIIIDGPPGIGCPVTSALSGADIVIMVTEPTESGVHDLQRVIEIAKHFKPKIGIIINKFDINTDISDFIVKFANEKNIDIIGKIPFDLCIVNSLNNIQTPLENNDCKNIKNEIENIYKYILKNGEINVK